MLETPTSVDLGRAQSLGIGVIRSLFAVAIIALGLGFATERFLLVSLGAYCITGLFSALLFQRRLRDYQKHALQRDAWGAEEDRLRLISGGFLYALVAYILIQAVYEFVSDHHEAVPLFGIIAAYVNSIIMPFLARAKFTLARALDSRAMHANAVETFAYGYLSLMVLIGLSFSVVHDHWLDTLGSLLIAPWLILEARRALR